VQELQEEIKQRDHEIIRLQTRLRRVRSAQDRKLQKDSGIATRDAVILSLKKRLRREERANRTLHKRLDRMKTFDELMAIDRDVIPVKVLSSFTKEGLKLLMDEMGIKEGDLVYVHKIEGWGRGLVKDLAEMGIGALIAGISNDPQFREVCLEYRLPLLTATDVGAMVRGKTGVIVKEKLRKCMSEWEMQHEQYEREKHTKKLEHLFREYQAERGKEMKKVG
jgi:predicted RNase H-like nuclease (RuvC/YqgF family)